MKVPSMRECITKDSLANRIRMKRTQYSGSFFIVEGVSDEKLYSRFIHCTKCKIEVSTQKDIALKALEILEKDNFKGILAVVDSDYWLISKCNIPISKNLHITDSHDLETLLLQSPALEKLILEFSSQEKLNILLTKRKKDIRKILLECAEPIGYLRWLSLRDNLNLKFEGLKYHKFINKELSIDLEKLIIQIKNNSIAHSLDGNLIKESIANLLSEMHDPWHICCGHDLCEILSFAFREVIGSKNTTPKDIETNLRLSYEENFFIQTQLYSSLKTWEQNNMPFVIFNTANKPALT